MGATAQGIFAALISQGLPCKISLIFLKSNSEALIPIIALFSLYVTPNSVGKAELTLGGTDSTKFTGLWAFLLLTGDFPG